MAHKIAESVSAKLSEKSLANVDYSFKSVITYNILIPTTVCSRADFPKYLCLAYRALK